MHINISKINNIVQNLNSSEIKEVTAGIEASSTKKGICLWAQLGKSESEDYFVDKYKPFVSDIIPIDYLEKEVFYKLLVKKIVIEWKKDIKNIRLKSKLSSMIKSCLLDLYGVKVYKQNLTSNGYDVNEAGIVIGVNEDYQLIIKKYAEELGYDIDDLKERVGGITKDLLRKAKRNIRLNTDDIHFINSFINYSRSLPKSKDSKINSLRTASEIRKFYFDVGLTPDDLMKLWGVTHDFKKTICLLKKFAKEGQSYESFVSNLLEVDKSSVIFESRVMRNISIKLDLVSKRQSIENIKKRNRKIIDKIQKIVKYKELTGKNITPKSLLINTKDGTKSRAVNIEYLNSQNEVINVSMIYAYKPEQRFAKTLAHEFTHEIHLDLLNRCHGDRGKEGSTSSSIMELFALLVDDSVSNIYSNLSDVKSENNDTYYKSFIQWFQYVFGYSQMRFIEEIYNNLNLTDCELLKIEERITKEVHGLLKFEIEETGQILDFTEIRRAEISTDRVSDGLVYVIKDLNSHKTEKKKKHYVPIEKSSLKLGALQNYMNKTWGLEWILNDNAYRLLIAAMIESINFDKTTEIEQFAIDLHSKGDKAVENYLERYEINISD